MVERRLHKRQSSGSSLTSDSCSYFSILFLLSFSISFSLPLPFFFNGCQPNLSNIPFGSDNTGEYSVLRLYIVPPCGRANTAPLELNIPLYCPPSHAIIYIYIMPEEVVRCTTGSCGMCNAWKYHKPKNLQQKCPTLLPQAQTKQLQA